MRTTLAAALLVVFAGSTTMAQVTHVAGTGCGAPETYVGGSPRIGQPISISNSFTCLFSTAVLGIGIQGAAVPWPGCGGAACTIGVLPVELTAGGGSIWRTIWIPNDPTLSGLCFFAQAGCVAIATGCAQLDQTARICIQ
jgi:hypothetical protein